MGRVFRRVSFVGRSSLLRGSFIRGLTVCVHKHVIPASPGLHYLEEVETEGDPAAVFYCTLCRVQCDYGNHALHLTSTAHYLAVLVRVLISAHHAGMKAGEVPLTHSWVDGLVTSQLSLMVEH